MKAGYRAIPVLSRESWQEEALCAQVDPELFFADKGDWSKTVRAKIVCRKCPVREACLAYALEHNMNHGVWGGTTSEQRKRLRSEHRAGNGHRGLAG